MIQNLIFKIVFLKMFKVSSAQKVPKLAKTTVKDNSFYNTVLLKKLHSFYEPNSH